MILSFLCIPHIPVGYAGGTTPRMGEVELRREQQSRAPTVGALGAAFAPRQLLLRCSTSCIRAVVLTLSTYIRVGNAGAIAENTEFLIYSINEIIFSVSSATAPCVALPPASVQSFVFSVVNNPFSLIWIILSQSLRHGNAVSASPRLNLY